MRKKLITLSGLDSAGKSTQIAILENYLETKNIKKIVIWSRGGYTPLFNLLKYLLRKTTVDKLPRPGKSKERDKAFGKKWIRVLWLHLAILDLIIFYGIYFRLLTLSGFTVIADRFIHDTYVDWRLGFRNENFEDYLFWKILIYLSPEPNVSILLTISVKEALRRSQLKNEEFSESPSTREKRRGFYMELVKEGRWESIVDGSETPENVWSSVKSKLE